MLDLRMIGLIVLGCGAIVEVLKVQGLKTNILALISTILGVILTIGLLGYDGGYSVIFERVVYGAVIGAATSGVYDIIKGIKQALSIGKQIVEFDLGDGGLEDSVDPIDFP